MYKLLFGTIGGMLGVLVGVVFEFINNIINEYVVYIDFIEYICVGLVSALYFAPIENEFLCKLSSNIINYTETVKNKYKFAWGAFLFFLFFMLQIKGKLL